MLCVFTVSLLRLFKSGLLLVKQAGVLGNDTTWLWLDVWMARYMISTCITVKPPTFGLMSGVIYVCVVRGEAPKGCTIVYSDVWLVQCQIGGWIGRAVMAAGFGQQRCCAVTHGWVQENTDSWFRAAGWCFVLMGPFADSTLRNWR
jgi:hypothetical protein